MFVRPGGANDSYTDVPLAIGGGQKMSGPSMIAIMLEEARLVPGDRVLEIGTGSGYHAALVAHLVGPQNVVSIERIPRLAEWGRSNLARAGLAAAAAGVGAGGPGSPQRAPQHSLSA